MTTSVHSDDETQTPRHFSSPSMDSFPFFADAQLDLEEAHDIADTPEATRPQLDHQKQLTMDRNLQLPSLRSDGILRSGGATVREIQEEQQHATDPIETNHDENNGREKRNFSSITSTLEISNMSQPFKRKPRMPRDIPWLVAFLCFVPLTLIITSLHSATGALAKHPLSFATLHAITWTALATLLLSRGLYQTAAAGEGDDTRQHIANGLIWLARSAPLIALVLFVTLWSAGIRHSSIVFLLLAVRCVTVFTKRWNAKVAFTSAMTCMALDILSRSLRRASFLRALMAVLALQTFLMVWWRRALLGSQTSFGTVCVFIAGQWAMWTVQKVLAYLAATGVMDWCSQQLTLLTTIPEGEFENDEDDDYDYDLPEAYSNVDASVYQSVLVTEDELLEDDYDEELDKEVQGQSSSSNHQQSQQQHGLPTQMHRATVKSTLFSAFTISFGSIAHAGLLGSMSHFLWKHKLFLNFATAHSDMGLAHTAVYFKNHSKGSRDVLAILASSATEPLTASIKASYVAFSQSPRCLSQAYPLIYHRLNRLSGTRRR